MPRAVAATAFVYLRLTRVEEYQQTCIVRVIRVINDRVNQVCAALMGLVALVEADIDFAEEPIEFISPDAAGQRLRSISDSFPNISTSWPN